MKKYLFLLSVIAGMVSTVLAAPFNEYTVHDDTQQSAIRSDLTKLRALHVIPYEKGDKSQFNETSALTRKELGYWATSFLVNPENDGTFSYTAEALNLGILNKTEGTATYQDVMQAYFGKESLKDKDVVALIEGKETKSISKKQAVLLLGKMLHRENGNDLVMKAHVRVGEKGTITSIQKKENTYFLSVDGIQYEMDKNVYLLHGPTNIKEWNQKQIDTYWLRTSYSNNQPKTTVVFVEANQQAFSDNSYSPKEQLNDENQHAFSWEIMISTIIVVVVAVFGLVVWLKLRGRKKD